MPLMPGKSRNAFSHNVATEMDAGKPQNQALAIAYRMKRKKMGYGGMAEGGMMHADDEYDPMQHPGPKRSEGAEMEDDDMIDRIMRQCYSEGGRVANETPWTADFEPNEFDELVKDDDLEGHYPGSQEIGDEQEDMDRHDIVSRIMRSRAKRPGHNPRPA